jgi:hypothetical protein
MISRQKILAGVLALACALLFFHQYHALMELLGNFYYKGPTTLPVDGARRLVVDGFQWLLPAEIAVLVYELCKGKGKDNGKCKAPVPVGLLCKV